MLPKEVLQHIFSVGQPGCDCSELDVGDRVRLITYVPCATPNFRVRTPGSASQPAAALQLRAMAVCSAWRDCLNPRKWPIGTLELDAWEDDNQHMLPWVSSTRPAVKALDISHYETPQLLTVLASVPHRALESLSLVAASQTILDCLPDIYVFQSLRELSFLFEKGDCDVPFLFNFKALTPLTALEELVVSGRENLCWEGGPPLPRVTELQLSTTDSVTLDAALPSLQQLIVNGSSITLGGQHLWVSRLSRLLLHSAGKALSVSWGQLGSLKELEVYLMTTEVVVLGAAELSALTNLTALSLSLGWGERQEAWGSAHVLLQAAPRSLWSLSLAAWPADRVPPSALDGFTQLTSLECGSLAIIPHLFQLKHLQALQFNCVLAASLLVHELAMLSELASLRRLRFFQRREEVGGWARCSKVLQAVLPRGCKVERATMRPLRL